VFALQVALVHLSYNVLGVVVIYGLPFLRVIPTRADEGLAALAARRKLYVALYILLVFFLIPAVLIGVSQSVGW